MPNFDVTLMTTWTYSGTYSLVIGGMRRHDPHVSSLQFGCWCCMLLYAPVCSHFRYLKNLVKVHFRGPTLYNKKGALFQEESYLPRILRSSSWNLHTFHLIHIVFWWQIFFRKHGKSAPNDRQDHHVLVVVVVIMTLQGSDTRALSQSHVAKHDNHVPVAPLIGSGVGVMSMQWLPYGKIISAKTLKLHSNRGHPYTTVSPTCSRRHKDTR